MQERPITRIPPKGPPQAYKSFQILTPPSTHMRRAGCEEVECTAYLNGWVTKIDESTDLGKQQAWYIRNKAGRRYKEERRGPLTLFMFYPGQQCFRPHQVRLERPSLFIVKDGDWRMSQNPRQHSSPEDWVDEFRNHQDMVAEHHKKG